ncbi:MAG: hypothetical protein HZB50_12175 [Chloroflexi bacterium]|nr:hypothetical protein [Chloroflexota bacterium]
MIKLKFISSAIVFMSTMVACSNNVPVSIPTINASEISTIIVATLSAIPTNTPQPIPSAIVSPIPTNSANTEGWIWHNIDLYALKIKLPIGWLITEINRRPEPTGIGGPITGHDCADYNISDPDGTMRISLLPTCGFAEGVGDSCPKDSIIVSKVSNKIVLIRYYVKNESVYIYTKAGLAAISDKYGTRSEMLCSSPPILSFGEDQNLRFIYIEFKYLGTDVDINQKLDLIDNVVLSIDEQ